MALQGRRQMYFNVIFIGQLYLEMHMSLLQLVILAKEAETYQGRTRCQYILVAVDYVSKWVEVVALSSNDAKVVEKFLRKNIFTQFGTPRAIISE